MPSPKKVPARYIGAHSVRLAAGAGPFYDAEGTRLESLILRVGDTLMVPPHEVYGETLYRPDGRSGQPYSLGYGRVVLPEHLGETKLSALNALGYEFQPPRSDFEPLIPLAQYLASGGPDAHVPAAEPEEPTIADLRVFLAPESAASVSAAAEPAPASAPKPATAPAPAPATKPATPAVDAEQTPPADAQ